MTDIEKLKQDVEDARKALIGHIRSNPNSGIDTPVEVANAFTALADAKDKLQAAEKETEAHKYDPPELSRSMFATKGQYISAVEKPAPIADDGWITRTGNEEAIVPFYEMVELKFYDGQRSGPGMLASSVDWASPQIIAYRIITPAADRVGEP